MTDCLTSFCLSAFKIALYTEHGVCVGVVYGMVRGSQDSVPKATKAWGPGVGLSGKRNMERGFLREIS